MSISKQELIKTLQKYQPKKIGFIDKLKISYRPMVCPFDDLLDIIPEHESIFDIGCGSGMFLSLVATYKNPEKVYGIEIDDKLIENAKKIFKNINVPSEFKKYNGNILPQEINSFKYITLIDVLHHIPKYNQIIFLKNIFDMMNEESILIIKDIDRKNPLHYWNKIHDMVFSGEIGSEPNSVELQNELTNMGFKEITKSYRTMLLYPHFTLICQK
ncbi:MAG: hypothetical protein VR77_02940 [Flavobacteriales bacterium BRH_c54]|nr:MAG: hypothetical protein VR77_02940 [Flavobacteriales bacterium BRH_c54]